MHRYQVKCEIRDLGEPGRFEERKEDPKSILTADISMEGEGAGDCLINLLNGMLNGDPKIAESKAMAKYIENAIKNDSKKEKTIEGPELIASAKKIAYDGRPSISIKVYRIG